MKKELLSNNIELVIKQNPKTPRIALDVAFELNIKENKPGLYSIMNRLLSQGTTNRTAEEIASELEENAIECYSTIHNDYLSFSVVCLNETLETALEILSDIIQNSHFKNFDKEVYKMKGEFEAELDSPKVLASDNYMRTIFKNHFYGNTYTKILESIDSITADEVSSAYRELCDNSRKVITVVGDFEEDYIKGLLERKFKFLKSAPAIKPSSNFLTLDETVISTVKKENAQQAQIIKGWLVPSLYSAEYPAFVVMNSILGSSGLSSRLFTELREKRGLAYTVRSRYETSAQAAHFNVYIGTEPRNIKVALQGFDTETEKIRNYPVSDVELEHGINNVIGKKMFFSETNSQQSNLLSFYEAYSLGYDYYDKFIQNIKAVTKEDILNAANKYLNNTYVLTILAPEKYLENL